MSAFVKALSGQQFLYAVSAANEKDPVCVCVCHLISCVLSQAAHHMRSNVKCHTQSAHC